jgi:hypothetical protein
MKAAEMVVKYAKTIEALKVAQADVAECTAHMEEVLADDPNSPAWDGLNEERIGLAGYAEEIRRELDNFVTEECYEIPFQSARDATSTKFWTLAGF